MSRWTHINGGIRIDYIPLLDEPRLEELFKTCDYDSPSDEWDECNVPCGGEGSVSVSISRNSNTSSLAASQVAIFGDLRNFGNKNDIKKVEKWFSKICLHSKLFIRQAILQIEDESNENSCILYFEREDNGEGIIKKYKTKGE